LAPSDPNRKRPQAQTLPPPDPHEPDEVSEEDFHELPSHDSPARSEEEQPFDEDEEDLSGSADRGDPSGRSHPRDPDEDIYGESDYPPDEEVYPEESRNSKVSAPPRSQQKEDTKVGSRALALRGNVRPREEDDEESEESTKAGNRSRLEVTDGPDAGRIKKLKRVRLVVGRSSECEFVLNDPSVSRRHFELVQGEKGVLLRDLGSGNGTRINGETVSEQILEHEDEIALGRTRIRFHDEETALKRLQEEVELARSARAAELPEDDSGAQQSAIERAEEEGDDDHPFEDGDDHREVVEASLVPSSAWGRAQKKVGWSGLSAMQRRAVTAGVVLGLLMVGSLFFLTRPTRPLPPDPRQVAASQRMEEARLAFEAGKYDEANQKIDAAERLAPGSDKEHLKERIAQETIAQEAIRAAEAAIESADFIGARTLLKKVPDQSIHRDHRDALTRDAIEKEADFIYRQVAAAFETQNVEAAERALRIVTPEAREVLGKRLTDFESRLDELRASADRRAEELRQEREAELAREREAELATAYSSVSRRFNVGEYDRAVLEIDRVVERYTDNPRVADRAIELRRLIPVFAVAYEDGRRKFDAEAMENAVRPLQRARELYREIDLPGAIGTRLDQDLTTALVASGESRLLSQDWADAAHDFREALSISENEPGARRGLERLNRQAEQIYLEGMRLMKSDPATARNKLTLAADIASPDSATHRKAREQLGTHPAGSPL
jgi:pSer/pThr/pTyr-binding forkhead associated (FHA) protein